MYCKGLSKEQIAQVWYDSITLFSNPKYPTMTDCKSAVVKSATNYAKAKLPSSSRTAFINDVKWAFSQVGL